MKTKKRVGAKRVEKLIEAWSILMVLATYSHPTAMSDRSAPDRYGTMLGLAEKAWLCVNPYYVLKGGKMDMALIGPMSKIELLLQLTRNDGVVEPERRLSVTHEVVVDAIAMFEPLIEADSF